MKNETANVSGETQRQASTAWRTLEKALGLGVAGILTAMMILTGADVVARYALNAPIKGAFEMIEILLVCLVFLAMPLAMWDDIKRYAKERGIDAGACR